MQDPARSSAAWAFALPVWLLLAGVCSKVAVGAQLAFDEGAWAPLLWFPSTVGGEAVLAGLLGVAAWRLRRSRVALMALCALSLAAVLWMDANVLSYAIDQTPITWWRLRGGEGGGLESLALIEPSDVTPLVVLGALQLALARLLWRAALEARRLPMAAPMFLVGGVVLMMFDRGFAHAHNRGLGEQAVFVLLNSMVHMPAAAGTKEPVPVAFAELARSRSQTHDDDALPRAGPAAKNAIVFFAEGIPRELTTLGDPALHTTPLLAARAQQSGVELVSHRATFHRSIAALYSLACSDYPPPDGTSMTAINPRADCGEMSDLFASHDVRTGYFHGGPFGFYDKLAFFGGRSWDALVDSSSLNDGRWFTHRWGVDDRATVQATLQWIDGLKGERFVALVVPIAAHYPYEIPPDLPAAEGTSRRARFLADVAYVDRVFDDLMEGLGARGLLDDTLVAFVADHGAVFPVHPHQTRGARLAYDSNLRVPAVLFGPPFSVPAQVDENTSHLDLLPTLLDAMDLPLDARHRGRSLLRAAPPRRTFIGARLGDATIAGFVDGSRKFLINTQSGDIELYDLARDPFEQRDISDGLDGATLQAWRDDALRFVAAQDLHLRQLPMRGGALDVPGALLRDAQVSARTGDTTLPCARDATGWICGDAPVVLGRREVAIDGVARDCVVVRPPSRGSLTLTLSGDRQLLSTLSQARLARVDADSESRFQLSARADAHSSDAADATRGRRGRISADDPIARVSFAVAREHLAIEVRSLDNVSGELCLALDDKSWRARFEDID